MRRMWIGYMAGCLWSVALCASCSPNDEQVSEQAGAVVGQTGDHLVSGPEVVNQYVPLARDVSAGAKGVVVQNLSMLPVLRAGDVLFIIQMQGASVDLLADDARYGQLMDLGTAGRYELVTVTGVDPTSSTIAVSGRGIGGGLQFSYSPAGHTQVISVPQYKALSIDAAGVLSANPWNGSTGGVVAVTADTVQVDGTISASGLGFRGGQLQNGVNLNYLGFRTATTPFAAERGEGVGGSQTDYDVVFGRLGRGAAANGGGGGNAANSPGGGGANGLAMGKVWTGQGVMDISTANYQMAWKLDPAYAMNNSFADSAGGGRGGYGCSLAVQDPTLSGPSSGVWACAGNDRPAVGGLGGRPLPSDVRGRLFFGGGGGAGQEDNNQGGPGGNGGGLVFVLSRTIQGQGMINADGAAGGSASNDAPGGGGGGGTVVLMASQSIGTLQVSAAGGSGGRHSSTSPPEAEGGGGGGGGGFIATVGQTTAQVAAAGGKAGTTSAPVMAKFPMNGGTDGARGATSQVASFDPNLLPPVNATDLEVTLGFGATMRPGYTPIPMYATVTNLGPDAATNVVLSITLPPGIPGTVNHANDFTCTQQAQTVTCSALAIALNKSELIEFTLNLPRNPQGPFMVNAAVSGGGYDYIPANNQSTISGEVFGYVQFSGNGLSCSQSGRAASSAPAGLVALLLSVLLLTLRRLRARALLLALGLAGAQGCTPPEHPPLNLQVTVTGQGTVSSNPMIGIPDMRASIDCGAQCQAPVLPGTEVVLTTTPGPGQRFVQWDGRCQGTQSECHLTLLGDAQVTATFAPIPLTCFDGIQNATETDVDCGGSCGPCDDGRLCQGVADCKSGQCAKGLCSSCPLGKELLINGNVEAGQGTGNPSQQVFVPGWATNGMTVLLYDTPGYVLTTDPGPANRGKNFFMGSTVASAVATQAVELRSCATLISKGAVGFTVSASLGGVQNKDDNAVLAFDFQNNQGATQLLVKLGPVTNMDRGNATALLARMNTGLLPVGTQRAIITLTSTRVAPTSVSNDGYADNMSLILSLN